MPREHRPVRSDPADDEVARLFGSTWPEVVRFARRRVGCLGVAEDIAATVFAEALRSQARGVRIERGWLFTVAQRRIVDHYRRTARRDVVHEDLRARGRIEGTASPTDHLDDLRDAMRRLSTSHRVVLTAKYLDGHSVAEIADRLDVSYSAAESTLARARRALAAALRVDHPHEVDTGWAVSA